MFCQKKCCPSPSMIVMKTLCITATAIGTVAVVAFHLSKFNCFGKRAKHLACECEGAMEDAAGRITHAVGDCICDDNQSPDKKSRKKQDSCPDCD